MREETSRTRRLALLSTVGLLSLVTTACGADRPTRPATTAVTTTSTITQTPPTTSTQTSSATTTVAEGDGEGIDPTETAAPTASPFDAAEAKQWAAAQTTATAFMKAWIARPGDTRDRWFARVAPYLTVEGRGTYAGVWPIKGAWSRVTGAATVRPWADAEMGALDLPVTIPTDVGTVTVHIDGTQTQGLVNSFELPGQQG